MTGLVSQELRAGSGRMKDLADLDVEQAEPGGVNWTIRKPLSNEKSASSLQSSRA
jgi:hypothetical protein